MNTEPLVSSHLNFECKQSYRQLQKCECVEGFDVSSTNDEPLSKLSTPTISFICRCQFTVQ